jgi:hypothetical protein
MPEADVERLWKEYRHPFCDFDDTTLARWLSQTLGQLEGRAWRGSHPLVSSARVAAEEANERNVWHKRLASPPAAYPFCELCRAPFLPFFTRESGKEGLFCFHCSEPAIPIEDLPPALGQELKEWSDRYSEVHAVAHWDEQRQRTVPDYTAALEEAASRAEGLLSEAAQGFLPRLLDSYPAVVWEDQDECLEVRPEDISLT